MLGAAVLLLFQACGSEDDKKKNVGPGYEPSENGGDAGADTGGTGTGGSVSEGGTGANTSEGGTEGGGTDAGGTAAGGASGGTSSGGTNSGGAANGGDATGGNGDPGVPCQEGFAECDGNPSTVCEQDLGLVLSCGDCDTTCSSDHGAVECDDGACNMLSCDAGYGDCNDDGKDGCETAITNNAANCGACGRNCAALGATCTNQNRCSAIAMQTNFAGGTDGGANRMWALSADGLLNAGYYNYAVRRFPLTGTGSATVWVGTNAHIGAQTLLVQGSDVLWAQRGTPHTVLKKALTAEADVLPTVLFYPEFQPTFLRQSGNAYFWITGDYQAGEQSYVYTRATSAASNVAGTRIVTVSQGTHAEVTAFDVASDAIYWVTTDNANSTVANELRTTPLAGGMPSAVPPVAGATDTVITSSLAPTLRTVGNTLYFTRSVGTSQINGIYRYRVGDAAPTQVVNADAIVTMFVDESYAYYNRQSTAGVWRAPLTGGAGVQISDGSVTRLVGIDDKFVYAIVSSCCQSSLSKIIK